MGIYNWKVNKTKVVTETENFKSVLVKIIEWYANKCFENM